MCIYMNIYIYVILIYTEYIKYVIIVFFAKKKAHLVCVFHNSPFPSSFLGGVPLFSTNFTRPSGVEGGHTAQLFEESNVRSLKKGDRGWIWGPVEG